MNFIIFVCFIPQVTRHLLKLFDNIADLRFKDSDGGGGGEEDGEAVAIGMFSREGEYVPFFEPCVCEGQVLKIRIRCMCVQSRCTLPHCYINMSLLFIICTVCTLSCVQTFAMCNHAVPFPIII